MLSNIIERLIQFLPNQGVYFVYFFTSFCFLFHLCIWTQSPVSNYIFKIIMSNVRKLNLFICCFVPLLLFDIYTNLFCFCCIWILKFLFIKRKRTEPKERKTIIMLFIFGLLMSRSLLNVSLFHDFCHFIIFVICLLRISKLFIEVRGW